MIRLCPVCAAACDVPAHLLGPVQCAACGARFLADTQASDDPLASLPPARPQRVEIAQGTDAWREMRRSLRMASETPAVLGLSSFSNAAANLRAEKRGKRIFVNAAMRKGTEQEPFARAAYAASHGVCDAAMYVDGAYGCSLDGISADGRTVLEIKTPYRGRAHDLAVGLCADPAPADGLPGRARASVRVGCRNAHGRESRNLARPGFLAAHP